MRVSGVFPASVVVAEIQNISRLRDARISARCERRERGTHRDLGRLEGGDGAGEGGSNAGHFRRFDVCV